ncbi:MAG: hypothetical protein ABI585_08485, partial [Betaproteobacteria bacterium]
SGCGLELIYADWKVDQLCQNDGGVKVYVNDFPPTGFVKVDGSFDLEALNRATPAQSYFLQQSWTKTAVPIAGTEVTRWETRLIRLQDNKVLGTMIGYVRPGENTGVPLLSRRGHICPRSQDVMQLVNGVFYSNQQSR